MSIVLQGALLDADRIPPNEAGTDADDFQEVLEKIVAGFARIPEHVAEPIGTFTCFNRTGRRTPIFWCFNTYAEPVFFAHHLGPDQPLYAMRSFHEIVDERSRRLIYRPRLAKIYADEILKACENKKVIIGGNCQSAAIIEDVAHEIIAKTGNAPLVLMLEFDPAKAYRGSLLMMFGDKSEEFNPFLSDKDPVPYWKDRHRNFAWGIVRGTHGSYFTEPAIFDLVDFVYQAINEFEQHGDIVGGERHLSDRSRR